MENQVSSLQLIIEDLKSQIVRLSEERAIYSALSAQYRVENEGLKQQIKKLQEENSLLLNGKKQREEQQKDGSKQ